MPAASLAVVRALLEGRPGADDPAVSFVQVMLSGFGYNFHAAANVARANDQLVRARAAELLGEAGKRLTELERAFRDEYVPPATRAQPFPPDDVMKALRQLDALRRRVGEIGSTVLTLETPGTDRIWARFREERALLEQLVAADIGLVGGAQEVLEVVRTLTSSAVRQQQLSAVDVPLAALEQAMRDRRGLLAFLGA